MQSNVIQVIYADLKQSKKIAEIIFYMEKTLEIPRITNTTIKYFVDGEYVDNVNTDEVNKIRIPMIKWEKK